MLVDIILKQIDLEIQKELKQNEKEELLKDELEMPREKMEKGALDFRQSENQWDKLDYYLTKLKKELEMTNQLLGTTQQMISNTEDNKLKKEMPKTVEHIEHTIKVIGELRKMISGKVTPVNPKGKSPEEAFREQIAATGNLSHEEQKYFATGAGNNSPTAKSRGDNDDGPQPSLEAILID